MYKISESQYFGDPKGRIRDAGGRIEEGVSAFGKRKSSTANCFAPESGERRGLGSDGGVRGNVRLFFRWSGVCMGEGNGGLVFSFCATASSIVAGSMSRSGIGGNDTGRRVARSNTKRNAALLRWGC